MTAIAFPYSNWLLHHSPGVFHSKIIKVNSKQHVTFKWKLAEIAHDF